MVLEFLGLHREASYYEKDLEGAIITHLLLLPVRHHQNGERTGTKTPQHQPWPLPLLIVEQKYSFGQIISPFS